MELLIDLPVTVYVDNKGAIFMANNPVIKRTKHIHARYHLIRQYINDGIIYIQFLASNKNIADLFTKNTSGETFDKHMGNIMNEFSCDSNKE